MVVEKDNSIDHTFNGGRVDVREDSEYVKQDFKTTKSIPCQKSDICVV